MSAKKMHADEVDIDVSLVRRLLAAQFPQWADLPIRAVQSTATVNAIYRLGDDLYARLPRVRAWARDLDKEWDWLPKLAPRLSLQVPEPVGKGHPAGSYPFSWAIYGWIDGQPYSDELVDDERQAARDLARFVIELRRIDPVAGAPRGGRRPLRELDAATRFRSPSPWRRGLRPTVIPGGGPSIGGSKVRPRPSGVSPIWSSSRQRSPTSSPPCIGSTPPVDRRPASTTSSCCGPLTVYYAETRQAIAALDGEIDTDAASAVWEAALAAEWHGPPVWFHGDIAWGNLLVEGGRLSAVIDFGTSGVGNPSCDLAIAWTLFGGESRNAFHAALQLGDATWARGRGWTLWKGLITLAEHLNTNPSEAENARRVIDEALADHRAE